MGGGRPWMWRCSQAGTSRGDDGVARALALALLVEGELVRRRQGEYAVRQHRPRAYAAVTCPPPPVVAGLHRMPFYNTNQWSARPGLDFAAIRRKALGRNLHQVAYLDQKIHQIPEYLDQKSIMSPSSSPSSRPLSPTVATLEHASSGAQRTKSEATPPPPATCPP